MAAACPDANAPLLAEAADAIEQHEAFKQEVSDALYDYFGDEHVECNGRLSRFFIIPKPDPLVEVMKELVLTARMTSSDLRAALEVRGLEIREKGQ
jgi:hypothetical protein